MATLPRAADFAMPYADISLPPMLLDYSAMPLYCYYVTPLFISAARHCHAGDCWLSYMLRYVCRTPLSRH